MYDEIVPFSIPGVGPTREEVCMGAVMKVVIPLVVVVGIGAGGFAWWKNRAPAAPKYVATALEKGTILGRVTATGTVSALVTVQVGAQVSGRIAMLNADFNAHVTKGQVLARLDPELFEAAAAQSRANEKAAEANVAKAKATVADSERKFKRARELAGQKLIAPADLDAAQADFEVSTAGVSAAEAALMQARASRQQSDVNLTYTVIKSPIDGTVISRAVDVGQTVAASLSAPTIFTIAENLMRMQVDTSVAEADVGKLTEGLETTFTVDAFPQRPFKGKIRQIRFAPQVVQNVVTYDAVIDVNNEDLALRPGMTANATFIFARADDVLRVPNAALRFRMDGESAGGPGGGRGGRDGGSGGWAGRGDPGSRDAADGGTAGAPGGKERDPSVKTVWVNRETGPERVVIKTGLSDGSFTQVVQVFKGELAEGDQVITDKQSDGSTPKPQGSGAPPGGGGMRRMF
jgi:HlyD family secretion protein